MFKQAAEENNCSSNTISTCCTIRYGKKIHKEDSFID